MARTISDEELQLKQRARRRLIGAIVLVAIIIVVLPMVLDTEPRQPGQSLSVQIPSPDSGAFATRVVPPPAPPAPGPAPAPKPEPAAKPKPDAGAAPTRSAATADKPPAPPAAARPAAPAKPPTSSKDGPFAVQVIALADAAKARQIQDKIAAAGIPAYTEVVKTVKGDVTRVRAGPFDSRAAAEKARDRLKSLGLGGNVITK